MKSHRLLKQTLALKNGSEEIKQLLELSDLFAPEVMVCDTLAAFKHRDKAPMCTLEKPAVLRM